MSTGHSSRSVRASKLKLSADQDNKVCITPEWVRDEKPRESVNNRS